MLAALTLASWSRKYNVPLVPLVDPDTAKTVNKVALDCVDDLESKLAILKDQGPLDRRFFRFDPTTMKPWSVFLAENSIAKVAAGLPVYLIQGTGDKLVSPTLVWKFASSLCRAGTPVTYAELKRVSHGKTALLGGSKAITWIAERFAGQPQKEACR